MIRIVSGLAICLAFVTPSPGQSGGDPFGVWLRGDGNAKVQIAPCGDKICATNLWIGDTSQGEEAGDRLIMSLEPKSANTLAGTAFDPKRSKSYSITVRVSGAKLRTRGCILGGIVCKNVDWTSAK